MCIKSVMYVLDTLIKEAVHMLHVHVCGMCIDCALKRPLWEIVVRVCGGAGALPPPL